MLYACAMNMRTTNATSIAPTRIGPHSRSARPNAERSSSVGGTKFSSGTAAEYRCFQRHNPQRSRDRGCSALVGKPAELQLVLVAPQQMGDSKQRADRATDPVSEIENPQLTEMAAFKPRGCRRGTSSRRREESRRRYRRWSRARVVPPRSLRLMTSPKTSPRASWSRRPLLRLRFA